MKSIFLLVISFFLTIFSFANPYNFTVAKDGTGNFKTVQEAINAVPDFRKNTTTIFIKKGTYKEKLIIPNSKQFVKFIGENLNETILTFDDYSSKLNTFGEGVGTSGSSSIYIYGDYFTAENITFENSSGPVGQAVAVWVAGDKCYFKNCRFLGYQDTLYTYGKDSKQFYENCYIEGTTDFIFGSSTVLFKNCEIHCKKGGTYITAASTIEGNKFGYVFMDCKITGEESLSYYLGRPWRPFAKVVYINCELPAFIKPEGWNNWGKESNEKTAFYAEYQNQGAGFKPTERVNWSHQLSDSEAQEYTLIKILNGWLPN